MNPDIRQKLFNYTQTPPASAWDRITDALDTPAYAQKLHDFEAEPPAAMWQAILKQVAPPKASVVPLRTKLFKYAIAAAVLLMIAAGSIFYITRGTTAHLADQKQNPISTGTTTATVDSQKQSNANKGTLQNETATANSDRDINSGIATVPDRELVHFSARVRIPKNGLPANEITIMPEEKSNITTQLPDRYMIATTGSGKAVRLPKKAYSDYACAESYQDYLCREKMAAIQSKMAASVATDFTDFIDLLKKLQEAQ
jgi:hypothetical protein